MKHRYLAVYEHRADGYSGYVPDLPGCISTGATLDEMKQRMRETVDALFVALAERDEEAPQPTTTTVHFPHPSEGHGIDHWVVERVEVKVSEFGDLRCESRTQTETQGN